MTLSVESRWREGSRGSPGEAIHLAKEKGARDGDAKSKKKKERDGGKLPRVRSGQDAKDLWYV